MQLKNNWKINLKDGVFGFKQSKLLRFLFLQQNYSLTSKLISVNKLDLELNRLNCQAMKKLLKLVKFQTWKSQS